MRDRISSWTGSIILIYRAWSGSLSRRRCIIRVNYRPDVHSCRESLFLPVPLCLDMPSRLQRYQLRRYSSTVPKLQVFHKLYRTFDWGRNRSTSNDYLYRSLILFCADPCGEETGSLFGDGSRYVKNALARSVHPRSQLLVAFVVSLPLTAIILSVLNCTFRERVVCASRGVVVKYLENKPHVSWESIKPKNFSESMPHLHACYKAMSAASGQKWRFIAIGDTIRADENGLVSWRQARMRRVDV